MLIELAVSNLGVIDELSLIVGPGMTVLSGETGAGKTLIIEAIDLLVGGRADPVLVRAGANEARVEGRFLVPASAPEAESEEVVLARVVPSEGRSRAYVNGRLATVATLAEYGRSLVDLHGQHAHQSLLSAAIQRNALDRFGAIDLSRRAEIVDQMSAITTAMESLGGDARTRAREIDLLTYQVGEIRSAKLADPDEDAALNAEQNLLANAEGFQATAVAAAESLSGDDGALDRIRLTIAAIHHAEPFRDLGQRLRSVTAELDDIGAEFRAHAEVIARDPGRLEAIRERRQLLRDLCRKYGDTLSEVMAFGAESQARLDELSTHDDRLRALEDELAAARDALGVEEARLFAARSKVAPKLAKAVTRHLPSLAMAAATLTVTIDGAAGDTVEYLLAANTGEPAQPLNKVASGGELARVMLALRLVLSEAPDTLVFDEVDAGIGGEAAGAVGRNLAKIANDHQVFVVTHLAQVAAYADQHIVVRKHEKAGRTISSITTVEGEERVAELARMLSGNGSSALARQHAAELLDTAKVMIP